MLFGDDYKFIKENITLSHLSFDHVYLINSTTRGEDFCLAVNYCDSMIMTASGSTFSWWISYLMSENSTIFYNSQVSDTADFSKDIYDYDYFLPEWIKLTASNGTVNVEDKWWYERTENIENQTESTRIFEIGFLILKKFDF
uniref:L-Fucosyltransferase n=1 Tax=Acrobeloides nanus TaxID=290746 RepID=A0A914CZK4_9BILA